jgi:hypothetical protein
MKTLILKLERHDDITSVRDKMGWAKNSRILLVWPDNESLMNKRLDLVLLQRRSQELGAQLALVSKDQEVLFHGLQIGIPVYKTLRKAQSQHWRVPYRFRNKKPPDLDKLRRMIDKNLITMPVRPAQNAHTMNPWVRLLFFALGVIALLAIAATLAPSAQVSLTPKMLVQDVIIDAHTNAEIEESNLTGAVPSEMVSAIVEGRDSIQTSGSIRLPDQYAVGEAIFKNLTDQPVEIPKGTVVRPIGQRAMRYMTLRDVTAPAGPGNIVNVPIRCLTPGIGGNLPAETLAAIEGNFGTKLSVVNLEPISGGSDRTEPAPNQNDRQQLAAQLRKSLEDTAKKEIKAKLEPGDLIIPSSLTLVETVDENYQPVDQQPSDLLTLIWQLRFQAAVIRHKNIEKMVQSVFDANLPAGYVSIPGSLQLEATEDPQSAGGEGYSWKIHASRRLQAEISESQAVRLALGSTPEQAVDRLQEAMPLELEPQVFLKPEWWPRLPVLPFRIMILSAPKINPDFVGFNDS